MGTAYVADRHPLFVLHLLHRFACLKLKLSYAFDYVQAHAQIGENGFAERICKVKLCVNVKNYPYYSTDLYDSLYGADAFVTAVFNPTERTD